MKVQVNKQVKLIWLSIICLLILVIGPVSAWADEDNKGSLKFKVDRIKGQTEQTDLRQTELERLFPTLFTDETKETIEEVKQENEKELNELKETIFFTNVETNQTVEKVKSALFTEEYTVVASHNNHEEGEDSGTGMSSTMLAVFSGLGLLLFGGLYFAMRAMLD